MQKTFRILGYILVVFIPAAVIFALWVTYYIPKETGDSIQSFFNLLFPLLGSAGVITVIVSLHELSSKYRREENDSILDAFNFFRTELLSKDEKTDKIADDLKINIPYVDKIKEGASFDLREMPDLDRDPFVKFEQDIMPQRDLRASMIGTINACEEFSAKVLMSGYSKHRAYRPLRRPFVDMVRKYSVLLYVLKVVDESDFTNMIELFKEWGREIETASMSDDERKEHRSNRIKKMHQQRREGQP